MSIISIGICVWAVKHERTFEVRSEPGKKSHWVTKPVAWSLGFRRWPQLDCVEFGSLQLELFCSVNILQFIFLSLRLDGFIMWSWVVCEPNFKRTLIQFPRWGFHTKSNPFWCEPHNKTSLCRTWLQLVFIPVWIVMCVALIGVLYAIILAILANLSVILLTPERRNETVWSALGYTCFVVPLLVFQVRPQFFICLWRLRKLCFEWSSSCQGSVPTNAVQRTTFTPRVCGRIRAWACSLKILVWWGKLRKCWPTRMSAHAKTIANCTCNCPCCRYCWCTRRIASKITRTSPSRFHSLCRCSRSSWCPSATRAATSVSVSRDLNLEISYNQYETAFHLWSAKLHHSDWNFHRLFPSHAGWFGLRKDFCPWLLGVCPVLQEYGNISYKVQSAAEEHEQQEQDAQNAAARKQATTPAKKGGSISEDNPRTVVPMMAIDVPDWCSRFALVCAALFYPWLPRRDGDEIPIGESRWKRLAAVDWDTSHILWNIGCHYQV